MMPGAAAGCAPDRLSSFRMFRCLPFLLSFFCCLCHADCAVSRSGSGTISIAVSGDGPCFRSPQQRQAFAEDFKAAVRNDPSARDKPSRDSHEALAGFDHLRRQSETLNQRGPVYYGQRR
jgi:hypothetical protein